MDTFIIFAASIALSLDSFAISLISGSQYKNLNHVKIFKLPIFFSISHSLFAVLGWYLGFNLEKVISSFDHWIAFALLLFTGIRMIIASLRKEKKKFSLKNLFKKPEKEKISNTKNLIPICVATSLDAFGLGLSFAFIKIGIIIPLTIISAVIFTTSLIGIFIGNRLKNKLAKEAEFAGGLVLIIIGIKILFDHIA